MKETHMINMLGRGDIRRDKDLIKNKKPNINRKSKVDPEAFLSELEKAEANLKENIPGLGENLDLSIWKEEQLWNYNFLKIQTH